MLCAGQVYRSTLTVHNQAGAPSGVALAITKADGTLVTPAPAPGPGSQVGTDWVVTYDYTLPTAGLFKFTWTTTGPGAAPVPDEVYVSEYRSILSLADAREYLDLRDTSRDQVLLSMLAAITRLIERRIGTCVIRTITGEWIGGTTACVIRLPSGPVPAADAVTSIASVWPSGPTWATADLIVNPAAGICYPATGWRFYGGPWRWYGTAGRLEISADVIEGAKAALFDLWAVQRGVSADQLEPSMEEVSAYETAVPPGWRLPPRVMQLIDGERTAIIA